MFSQVQLNLRMKTEKKIFLISFVGDVQYQVLNEELEQSFRLFGFKKKMLLCVWVKYKKHTYGVV